MSINTKNPISVKNLSWSYGERKIFESINLSIERGRFYSIIGPNGSGKSTLLKNMVKILEPEKNMIFIDGMDITGLKNRKVARSISYVPQNSNIDFDFSVMDVVLMGRNPYLGRFQNENSEDIDIVRKAMLATNTWHFRDKSINEISGGERQRVIIARALAQETGIMLLDEPVSQLDIHHQIEIMDTIRNLVDSKYLTVVVVLHDLNLASQYSDHIMLLYEGKIIAQGSPGRVLTVENMEKAYSLKVHIMDHPVTGKPHIIPIGSNNELAV